MTRKFAFAVLILALCALACKKSETAAPAPTTTTVSSNTTTTAPPPPTQTTATAAPPTATAAPPAATAAVVASSDGERQGTRIDVTEFKRTSGDTVTLKFVLSNNGSKRFDTWGHYLGDAELKDDHRGLGGIHLLDPVGKKKYFVVHDAENRCVCSREVADVEPGSRVSLWAKFPAPPPDVKKITIEVPHFQPMDDVPIQ